MSHSKEGDVGSETTYDKLVIPIEKREIGVIYK
jgi:hypothetical protein